MIRGGEEGKGIDEPVPVEAWAELPKFGATCLTELYSTIWEAIASAVNTTVVILKKTSGG